MNRRILQIMPADDWVACCWQGEDEKYAQIPLLGWALVKRTDQDNESVVGLCAMGDQSGKSVQVAPVIFADELVNFRFYHQAFEPESPGGDKPLSGAQQKQVVSVDKLPSQTRREQAILEAISELEAPTLREIAEFTGQDRGNCFRRIQRLIEQGKITKLGGYSTGYVLLEDETADPSHDG